MVYELRPKMLSITYYVEDSVFVGLDGKNQQLVYLKSMDDVFEDFNMRMAILNQFPTVNLYTTLRDAHAYIFKKWVIDFLALNKDLSSVREDLVQLLVRCQSSPRLIHCHEMDRGNRKC